MIGNETSSDRITQLAAYLKAIEEYELATGMTSQDKLDTEDARLKLNEHIRRGNQAVQELALNRAQRRAKRSK